MVVDDQNDVGEVNDVGGEDDVDEGDMWVKWVKKIGRR